MRTRVHIKTCATLLLIAPNWVQPRCCKLRCSCTKEYDPAIKNKPRAHTAVWVNLRHIMPVKELRHHRLLHQSPHSYLTVLWAEVSSSASHTAAVKVWARAVVTMRFSGAGPTAQLALAVAVSGPAICGTEASSLSSLPGEPLATSAHDTSAGSSKRANESPARSKSQALMS